ncbi:phosphotransferase [Nonomuraea sp. CA-141351]|uniref:phosphotransferase n=1 Tax=Nonomuraea sp. CA-141351 TaxID=3239996 RepID=UPI003D8E18E3
MWLHSGSYPANILTADGTICGVTDFGDLFTGDPAVDLAAAWTLLPDGTADSFYGAHQPAPDAATLRRARGMGRDPHPRRPPRRRRRCPRPTRRQGHMGAQRDTATPHR